LRRRAGAAARVVGTASLVAAMALAFIFGYDVATQCDHFRLRRLEITGLHALSREEVLERTGIRSGVNVLSVNLPLARKHLMAHPLVAGATVSRELPDTLRIAVEEHEPMAVLDLDRRFLLNTRGEIYKEMEDTDPQGLPLIQGLSFADIPVGDQPPSPAFRSVLEILHLGLREDAVLPVSRIRRIAVDREIGLTLHAEAPFGAVKIGYSLYGSKMARLGEVLRYTRQREEFLRLDVVDLVNLKRIVVTPAPPAPPAGGHKEA
jgi:cell division protein FtsQ